MKHREFLDTFDVGGIPDGKVTPAEFLNYYNNVSSSIDNDDYFELMMRNAWHISGGEGWCANSSCLRVLCKHADGHESVEEMKVTYMPRETPDMEAHTSIFREYLAVFNH
jgi:calcyphosin